MFESVRLTSQLFYDRDNVVVLEKADSGNTGCPGLEAGVRVRQRDSPKGQNRDVLLAGVPKKFQAGRMRLFFFEDWREDREGRVGSGCLGYFCRGVTRNSY